MIQVQEKSDLITLRNTKEELDFIVNSEREFENAKYVRQWTKEQHKNAMIQDDILNLVIEEKTTNTPVGYVIMDGITNVNKNIE